MFDDPAQQINELSTVVKQDIQALNQAISDLQTFSGGGANRQSADHSHTVIDALRSRLKDATQEFRTVLTLRTDSLKVHQERKALFTAAPEAGAGAQPPLFAQQQPGEEGRQEGRGGVPSRRADELCALSLCRCKLPSGKRAGLCPDTGAHSGRRHTKAVCCT